MQIKFLAVTLCYTKMLLILALVAYLDSGESAFQWDTEGVVPSTRVLRTMDGPENGNVVDKPNQSTTNGAEERLINGISLSYKLAKASEKIFGPSKWSQRQYASHLLDKMSNEREDLKNIETIFRTNPFVRYFESVQKISRTPYESAFEAVSKTFGPENAGKLALHLHAAILFSNSDHLKLLIELENAQFKKWIKHPNLYNQTMKQMGERKVNDYKFDQYLTNEWIRDLNNRFETFKKQQKNKASSDAAAGDFGVATTPKHRSVRI